MKKLLSIALALALVISLVPTVALAAEGDGMKFVFSATAYDSTTAINAETLKTKTDYAEIGTDPWKLINGQNTEYWFAVTGSKNVEGTSGTKTYSNPAGYTSDTYGQHSRLNALSWMAWGYRAATYTDATIDTTEKTFTGGTYKAQKNLNIALLLKIEETGSFIPKIAYESRSDLCIYDFYLVPASEVDVSTYNFSDDATKISRYISGEKPEKLGTVDMYDENPGSTNKVLDKYTVTETGEYYLLIQSNGLNEALRGPENFNVAANGKSVQYGARNYTNIYSFELIPEAQYKAEQEFAPSTDASYTEAPETATVTRLAYYGEDVAAEEIGDATSVDYGSSLTVDGAEPTVTKEDKTYNFLYWAKGLDNGDGNKQILSTASSFSYKPHEGNNYLIAVYKEAGKTEEAFYNYNGQLLTDLKIENGLLPALPAMAGLGNASGWIRVGDDKVYAANEDVSELTGDKVFMAKYDNGDAANITINGKNYAYDAKIICKDIVDNFDANTFSYWTRQIGDNEPEIISIDPDYSFYSFTDCTIAAVCNGKVELASPRKIALSTFSVGDKLTAVMAEFIGFDGAKEKGIMFGTKKIAMTTDYAQFTVTNDTANAVDVTGYAIVGDTKYIDGEITIDAAE